MKIKKILSLITHIVVLSELGHALSQQSNIQNQTANSTATSTAQQSENDGYDISETFTETLVNTLRQFHSTFQDFRSTNISFHRNGDPLDISIKLENSNYSLSFSNIVFATSSQNFINIDKVECNFDDDITLTVRVMPDKKLTFRGQLNITDFTESARYLRESTGHFTVSFEEIEFQFFYDTNDIYELDASVYHKKFSIEFDEISSWHESLVTKSVGNLLQRIKSALRLQINAKLNDFLQTKPSFRSMYAACVHHSEPILQKYRSFSSIDEHHYYMTNDSSEDRWKGVQFDIDSLRINGLLPFFELKIEYYNNTYIFSWERFNLKGYANWHYRSSKYEPDRFDKVEFEIPYSNICGVIKQGLVSDILVEFDPPAIKGKINDTLTSFASSILEQKIQEMAASSIKRSIISTYNRQ